MSDGPSSNYVKAAAIEQVGSTKPKAQVADVWLGSANQTDGNGDVFVTLEVQPAWGTIAQVRLSLDELQALRDLIDTRLDVDAVGPVSVTVPKGQTITVTYL